MTAASAATIGISILAALAAACSGLCARPAIANGFASLMVRAMPTARSRILGALSHLTGLDRDVH